MDRGSICPHELGSQMHGEVRLELRKQFCRRLLVADVQLMEAVTIAADCPGKRIEVASVGKLVDVGDDMHSVHQKVTDHGGAYEAGAAGAEGPGRAHKISGLSCSDKLETLVLPSSALHRAIRTCAANELLAGRVLACKLRVRVKTIFWRLLPLLSFPKVDCCCG